MPVRASHYSRGMAQCLGRDDHLAAILKDLSKAFDCLPHSLIEDKLKAYGLSENSVNLVSDYLAEINNVSKLKIVVAIFKLITKVSLSDPSLVLLYLFILFIYLFFLMTHSIL